MRTRLTGIYRKLLRAYGLQRWWPGDGPFEVMVGAVLTQNTAWRNVEQAIDNLKQAGWLSPERLLEVPERELAALIRPSGYHNLKAGRLRALCRWLRGRGGVAGVGGWPTADLRAALLAVRGIGPETADDILLYAFDRAVFVIDAYTRRIFSRAGLIDGGEPYEALRSDIEAALDGPASLYNEYHALLVRHAKAVCRPRPACRGCCIRERCAFGSRERGVGDRASEGGHRRGVGGGC